MLRGREFTLAEETSSSTPRVAIIDDRLAAALFRNEDPIGQIIRLSRQGDSLAAEDLEPMVVVGVAPSIREAVVDRAPLAHIYVPWGRHYRAGMHVHVRGSAGGDAAMSTLMASIRTELRAVDATLPVLQITTLQQFHDRGLVLWAVRTGGRMLTVFGILALALAVIGVYGVKAYIVSQRTREIGIRMALGASARHVRSLLLKEAMVLTAAGIALGLPVALLLGRALGSMLFSVSASDPLDLRGGAGDIGRRVDAGELHPGAAGGSRRSDHGAAGAMSAGTGRTGRGEPMKHLSSRGSRIRRLMTPYVTRDSRGPLRRRRQQCVWQEDCLGGFRWPVGLRRCCQVGR